MQAAMQVLGPYCMQDPLFLHLLAANNICT